MADKDKKKDKPVIPTRPARVKKPLRIKEKNEQLTGAQKNKLKNKLLDRHLFTADMADIVDTAADRQDIVNKLIAKGRTL